MNYTLAYDSNNDGIYDFSDQYISGTDNTAPTINISGLKAGRYNITVSSALDCNLRTFPLTILPCYPVLPVQLISFNITNNTNNQAVVNWSLAATENLQKVNIEQSTDGVLFTTAATIEGNSTGAKSYRYTIDHPATSYRLHIYNKDGSSIFSPVVSIANKDGFALNKLWPNPVKDMANADIYSLTDKVATYTIYTTQNRVAMEGKLHLHQGKNTISIAVSQLPAGTYQLVISSADNIPPILFRFVK